MRGEVQVEPLILVTNDDGVLSPGIAAAVEAVQELGEVLDQRSAVSADKHEPRVPDRR